MQPREPLIRAAARPASRVEFRGTATIRAAAGEGQQPRFDMIVNTGAPMRIGWFDAPVVVDLATLDLSAQRIPALYDHCPDADFVVGQTDAVTLEAGALRAAGAVIVDESLPTERNWAAKVLNKARAGYVWQTSIGADPASLEKIEPGKPVTVNGRDLTGPLYVARGCVLREVSFVVLGGDRHTSAVVARRRNRVEGAAMTFEEWLVSLGFEDQSGLSETQLANLKQRYMKEYPEDGAATTAEGETETEAPAEEPVAAEGETTDEEEIPTNAAARRPAVRGSANRTPSPVTTIRAQTAAEEQRIADVRRVCAAAGNPDVTVTINGQQRRVNLTAHAIAQGWDTQRVELQIYRHERGTGPAVISRNRDQTCTVQALQGAMILRAGGRLDHRAYATPQARFLNLPDWIRAGINDATRNRIMDAAHQFADMSAVDLARECLRIEGRALPHNRSEMIRAAFSSATLTNVFTTNVNAVLLSSYMESGDTTESWTTTTDVADFKMQERPRVDVGPGLSKLPRGAEADHAEYADSAESYSIARYAKQFVVDEQDIIDDRLGAMSDIPQRFGTAAARLRPDLVYSILLGNPTLAATARALFNTTDGNLGSSSALAAGTLKAAIAAVQNIRENSVNLNLVPTHLIVPPSLRFTAKELVSSAEIIIAGTAGSVTERGVRNVIADENLTVVSDSRLENGVTDPDSGTTHSGSATSWYLASTLAHTIEVAYLRGTGRAPRVRSGQLDRGQYGMWWDVILDIGAKALDWKGLRKTTA